MIPMPRSRQRQPEIDRDGDHVAGRVDAEVRRAEAHFCVRAVAPSRAALTGTRH